MLGLRVNLSNTSLIPIREIPNIHHLALFFDCGVSALPSTYLGLPSATSFKSKAVWELVVERFQKRLIGWKSKMSRGGRLTLLQSTLWNLPIHYMFSFTIPASIASQLGVMLDFLWSKHDSNRGFHWVSWDEICCPKEDGGLGIRPLQTMNEALKTNWLWRFAIEDDSLWKKVIVSKYVVDRFSWWSKRSSFAHAVGCWKSILSSLEVFKSFVHFEVRSGLGCFFGMIYGVGINH